MLKDMLTKAAIKSCIDKRKPPALIQHKIDISIPEPVYIHPMLIRQTARTRSEIQVNRRLPGTNEALNPVFSGNGYPSGRAQ
jgi:hypothetical protein